MNLKFNSNIYLVISNSFIWLHLASKFTIVILEIDLLIINGDIKAAGCNWKG